MASPSNERQRAVVIIPTYNERQGLAHTLEVVLKVLDTIKTWDMQVLVVDDTSPDKTYELVREWEQKDTRVHLTMNAVKSGLGGAYLKGMKCAFADLNADVVFEFDADLSHDPTKIPQFLTALDSGAEMVLGTRYKLGGSIAKEWAWHRKLLSVVGNIVIMTILFDFRYRDWTSGYRAIRHKVYESVSPLLKGDCFTGYTFQIGFLYYALRLGFRVDESVPYQFVDRTVGQSKIGPEYMKNTLMFIVRMKVEEIAANRLFKFLMVGGLGTVIQLLSLQLYRAILGPSFFELAVLLSIETAIISNFILSNIWTFADRKLTVSQIPSKFITFNVSSVGSIVIQLLCAWLGKTLIGLHTIVTPMLQIPIDTGLIFVAVGILLGMIWNYFAYSKIVWKK